jgi:hypothetical protein
MDEERAMTSNDDRRRIRTNPLTAGNHIANMTEARMSMRDQERVSNDDLGQRRSSEEDVTTAFSSHATRHDGQEL